MPLRQLPEWAPHERVWIGFPSHEVEWPGVLDAARGEVAAFANAVWAEGAGEMVVLVAADATAADAARGMAVPGVMVEEHRFGDIWLRDTGPIVLGKRGNRSAMDFGFNGWGGKYTMPGDEDIGARLAASIGMPVQTSDWIFEGGALDVDGTGLAVTTEQCLLNPNRNQGFSRAEVEARLAADLGIVRVLWLGEGLKGDHTDGHVDNLARFVAPGRLAIPSAAPGDPNAAIYADARTRAEAFGLEVAPLPSPGLDLPASYMNFYIGNAAVAVPIYGAPNDEPALQAIERMFPGRRIVGLRADHILTGGGSFHCISQQVPA